MPPACDSARLRDRALRVVAALPSEDRACEDVVEYLPASRLVRPQDAVVGEDAHDASHVVLRAMGELRKVGRLVGDLRARGRDEWSKSDAAMSRCSGRERLDRPLEVVGDDLPRAAEPGERRGAKRRRAARALDVPQALHHELEVRRLDPGRAAVPARVPRPPGPSSMRPAPTPSSTSPTSSSSIDHIPFELAPKRSSGSDDRRPPRGAIEPVQPQDVAEQARDGRFQPVERGKRVLAQRQQDVDAHRPVHQRGEHLVEARLRPPW